MGCHLATGTITFGRASGVEDFHVAGVDVGMLLCGTYVVMGKLLGLFLAAAVALGIASDLRTSKLGAGGFGGSSGKMLEHA